MYVCVCVCVSVCVYININRQYGKKISRFWKFSVDEYLSEIIWITINNVSCFILEITRIKELKQTKTFITIGSLTAESVYAV